MIRINLLGEKVDRSGAYFMHSVALASTTLVAMIVCFIFHDSMSLDFDLATQEKAILDGKLAKLRDKTKKVESLEKNKNLLKEKLTTIAKLKAKKSGPVHLLDDLTTSIPERSWLTGIKQRTDALEFQGIALDPQTVSGFMTKLLASSWISGVELVYSRQAMRKGVPIQEFSLLVKIKNALEVRKQKAEQEAGKTGAALPASAADAGKKPTETAPAAEAAAAAPAAPAVEKATEEKPAAGA